IDAAAEPERRRRGPPPDELLRVALKVGRVGTEVAAAHHTRTLRDLQITALGPLFDVAAEIRDRTLLRPDLARSLRADGKSLVIPGVLAVAIGWPAIAAAVNERRFWVGALRARREEVALQLQLRPSRFFGRIRTQFLPSPLAVRIRVAPVHTDP